MKIGDKVIALNIYDSDHLESNKAYVVVDVNQYGNIGLRDPERECLLPHYYTPCRFYIAPKHPPVEVGQIYKLKDTFRYYLVVGWNTRGYNLICMNGEGCWTPPVDDINDIFGSSDIESFKLVENPFKY